MSRIKLLIFPGNGRKKIQLVARMTDEDRYVVRTAVISMTSVVSAQMIRTTSHEFHILQTHYSFPFRRSHGVCVVRCDQSHLYTRVSGGGSRNSEFDTKNKFLVLSPNHRSKLVNSVGKVKNKGVLVKNQNLTRGSKLYQNCSIFDADSESEVEIGQFDRKV